ncbi:MULTISPECIES: hypothetical protein [Pseudomonas]|uniref:DUF2833 domain-containing protein n=3 Tax=Pseudomonas TaxID=286 RepID=A0A7X3F1M0_9PSED|nr:MULTISPECIES: hypothetical protein [Pseudomonas]MVF49530.1 hypothetical protein [Pseudomonas monteilii]MBP2084165.1 hypothetical protein [Pseudomonas sp. PvP089]MBP2090133.1 hypothetical protein [Pseudomonas sp. PvP088]MBP2223703.1 hypothetical protein [Pseudomonas putida]MCE0778207.1 hypothetical protein [Pseudomonas sp. NMI542_15]
MSNAARLSEVAWVLETTPTHCHELAANMREEDRDEIWKSSRLQPLEALLLGQMDSLRTWTFLVHGRVVAIFGVAPLTDMVGAPWMLASPELPQARKTFLAHCRDYINQMHELRPVLMNRAWTGNPVHLLWLRWLGFEFCDPEPFGPDGEAFQEFQKVQFPCVPS